MNTKNPVDCFIDVISTMDVRTRAYATRPVVSSMNATLIGLCAAMVAKSQPKEASGVDGYNDALAEALAELPPETTDDDVDGASEAEMATPSADAFSALKYIRDDILGRLNLSDSIVAAISQPAETMKFMMADQAISDVTVAALAKALNQPMEAVRKAVEDMQSRRRSTLNRDSATILDLIKEPAVGLYDFGDLPPRIQAKVTGKIVTALKRQADLALQSVINGRASRIGDVALLNAALKDVTEWFQVQCVTNPDLAIEAEAA